MNAAYLYYYATQQEPEKRLKDVLSDTLILAKNAGFDVFNCLALMDNELFMEELKFGAGDGVLNYYFYNYRCKGMDPKSVGLVLL